jgi:hypothetical protein
VPALPKDESKCPKCSDPSNARYIPCDRLYAYIYDTRFSAERALKTVYGNNIRSGRSELADRGPCSESTPYVTGLHFAYKSKSGGRAGAITNCECCKDTSSGAKIITKWNVIP